VNPFLLDGANIHGFEALADAESALWSVLAPRIALGWATVELDRAERETIDAFGSNGSPAVRSAADDELLGARARIVDFGPRLLLVLLEPITEGLIAASLARFGEGNVAVYLIVNDELSHVVARVQATGLSLSREGGGPFGRERLVGRGPRSGGHLILAASERQQADAS
jgi:hypothetical protein